MEEGLETKVSAARGSLEAGSGFAVARAVDVRAEHESPSAKLGGNGLQGSNPASQGSEMADRAPDLAVHNSTQCRAGRRCKGRQVLSLACAHKGLVATHRNQVKVG